MGLFYKGSVLILAVLFVAAPRVALSDDGTVVTSKLYVDSTKVAIHQGSANQVLQVNGSGDLAPVTMDTTPTASSAKPVTSGGVKSYAIQKPASASEGKVLSYGTSATADSQPVAQYVKVPVATGDPNASGATAPTAFSSVWIQ